MWNPGAVLVSLHWRNSHMLYPAVLERPVSLINATRKNYLLAFKQHLKTKHRRKENGALISHPPSPSSAYHAACNSICWQDLNAAMLLSGWMCQGNGVYGVTHEPTLSQHGKEPKLQLNMCNLWKEASKCRPCMSWLSCGHIYACDDLKTSIHKNNCQNVLCHLLNDWVCQDWKMCG